MKYNVGICLYGLPREIEICQKFNAPFFEKLNIFEAKSKGGSFWLTVPCRENMRCISMRISKSDQ